MIGFRTLSTLACCFLLSACSKENESSSDDGSSGDSSEVPQNVELSDALMEKYLAIYQEVKKAGESGVAALLTRHGWSLERWTQVSATVTQGMISAMNATVSASHDEALKQYDASIAELESQIAEANEEQAAGLKPSLEELKRARAELASSRVQASDLDRKNAEVLQRWMPRLEAASKDQ
ncbi:MAG: hypothetical protein IPN34_21865 [Planctomycetes bacterium]|nr:hypothetical protein [Planctomycetota bacterium]